METNFGIWSLVPAVITVLLCYKTRKVHWALFFGVMAGAFIFSKNFIYGLKQFAIYLFNSFTDAERLKITFFILAISAILRVLAETGASDKLGHYLGDKLKSRRKSRLAAFFISISLFIDDYANVLITGASVSPVFRKNHISSFKLAYFIDVIASVSSITLISTWAAFEISLIGGATKGILDQSPVTTFFASLPYHIFTILNIIFVFMVAYFGHWFYTKQIHSKIGKIEEHKKSARKRDMLVPFSALLIIAILGMFVGGYWATPAAERGNIVSIIGNAPSIDVLNFSVIIALIILTVLMFRDRILKPKEYSILLWEGIRELLPTGLVIILAKGLELVTIDLQTGYFISNAFKNFITPEFLSLFIFIISALVTIASGFSWSSMVLIMPIAAQMAAGSEPSVIYAVVAATISGAILGAQLIPYSDKAIMSAAACKIQPIDHINTQMPQILYVAGMAVLAYLLLIFLPIGWVYGIVIFLMAAGYLLIVKFQKNRMASANLH
ncbi:MAG: hypothetical protein JXQ65_09205 [Candidatus Marinimicrobia bacterium]|nr:hypothetical protein [Candidatus Neomarinimicrobiota bacterium]